MFGKKCSLIGCVHVYALPGSADYAGSMEKILSAALADALAYSQGGVDAIIVENMHDVPYLTGYVDPETVAAMAIVAAQVKQQSKLPVGVQLLAGANLEALGVAVASGLDFLRVEGFVFAHVGDEGMHESCAAKLLRRRAHLRAQHVKIFVDIKKKHSAHAITGDVSLEETAHAAAFFKADGVIVTGAATGKEPLLAEVESLSKACAGHVAGHEGKLPVLIGSGITAENIPAFAPLVDGLIVGSYAKHEGDWQNAVDKARVEKLKLAISKFQ